MKETCLKLAFAALLLVFTGACTVNYSLEWGDLPSWNAGPVKDSIVTFVKDVTDANGPHYVPPENRVAVFDNDGNLWAEKPTYFQILFILDRIRAMAPEHPDWASRQPFKAVLENDIDALVASGEHGFRELAATAQAGMSTDEFQKIATDWISTARHPTTGRAFTEMVYQPMLELLDYLRDHQFKVFIVSGGGVAFMRPWTEEVYGIPPENVVGTTLETRFEIRDGEAVIMRDPAIHFINDKGGKPVSIERFIGQRPIFASGNSDGDYQMLRWTTGGEGRRMGLLLHHTDAEREWAYDRDSREGRLVRALDEAQDHGWSVIDMARDWSVIFPPQ